MRSRKRKSHQKRHPSGPLERSSGYHRDKIIELQRQIWFSYRMYWRRKRTCCNRKSRQGWQGSRNGTRGTSISPEHRCRLCWKTTREQAFVQRWRSTYLLLLHRYPRSRWVTPRLVTMQLMTPRQPTVKMTWLLSVIRHLSETDLTRASHRSDAGLAEVAV